MSIVNGQTSSSITHVYTLLPVKVGTFKVGPFAFEYNGDAYSSNATDVEVVESKALLEEQPSPSGGPETTDLSQRIFLAMQVKKNTVYLNEIVPVVIRLFVDRLGVRDIQYPQFGHDGFSAGEFSQPRQYRQAVNGVTFDVVEFDTTIFGLKPGEFRLGPVQLPCNLIVKKQSRRQAPPNFDAFFNSDVFASLFGGTESYPLTLKSADIPMTVLPLPEEGKPEGFSGALGAFSFEATVSPTEVKVGDPMTLKAVVRGQGLQHRHHARHEFRR
jgi:hypothetical protein